MITGITSVLGTAGRAVAQAGAQAAEDEALTFGDALMKALGQVESQQQNANSIIDGFLRGDDVPLHEVMAAAEEAGIALEMLVEVRNKLIEAYRTIVSMQV